jgi:hypothetical protein
MAASQNFKPIKKRRKNRMGDFSCVFIPEHRRTIPANPFPSGGPAHILRSRS